MMMKMKKTRMMKITLTLTLRKYSLRFLKAKSSYHLLSSRNGIYLKTWKQQGTWAINSWRKSSKLQARCYYGFYNHLLFHHCYRYYSHYYYHFSRFHYRYYFHDIFNIMIMFYLYLSPYLILCNHDFYIHNYIIICVPPLLFFSFECQVWRT